MSWDEAFAQLQKKFPHIVERTQQAVLADAVFFSYETKTNLIGEAKTGTGKSFAYLIPAIYAAATGRRTVVSTETIALQDQLIDKDLPTLKSVFTKTPWTFTCLKGRSNYLCYNAVNVIKTGSVKYKKLCNELLGLQRSKLGVGERRDVEKALGYKLTDDEWEVICGNPERCADRKCMSEQCFSTEARARALASNIVVTNHALLQTDADMRSDGDDKDDDHNLLGNVDTVIVDEAHTLEKVLIDGWTDEITEWDVTTALHKMRDALPYSDMSTKQSEDLIGLQPILERCLGQITAIFSLRNPGDWDRQMFTICEVNVIGRGDAGLIDAMTKYEVNCLATLLESVEVLERARKKFVHDLDMAVSGKRKLGKAITATHWLKGIIELIAKAIPTRDGIVMLWGVPHIVTGRGIITNRGKRTIRLSVSPLDVSKRCAQYVWQGRRVILMSATLCDPVRNDFAYIRDSLGVPNPHALTVDSPFDYSKQQLVYVTNGEEPPEEGTHYSVQELINLIETVNGRTLALFTSRLELDLAAAALRAEQAAGRFQWNLLVQEKSGPAKAELSRIFREDTHSVLLATKSFFTGVDVPGDTCTLVAICRFPLPQYNSVCKAQIAWWRGRGYAEWYEREALMTFEQAAGRLIRNESDIGIIALLDQRVINKGGGPARKTALTGVGRLGGRVVRTVEDVRAFLGESVPV